MICVRHPQVLWDNVDGKVILCHLDTVRYYELNPVGAVVWQACNNVGLEAVIRLLIETYPQINPTQLAEDARTYVTALVDAHLLLLSDEQ